MKRDMDLVRDILMRVEAEGTDPISWIDNFEIEGQTDEVVSYHIWLLGEAGFLETSDCTSMGRVE